MDLLARLQVATGRAKDWALERYWEAVSVETERIKKFEIDRDGPIGCTPVISPLSQRGPSPCPDRERRLRSAATRKPVHNRNISNNGWKQGRTH